MKTIKIVHYQTGFDIFDNDRLIGWTYARHVIIWLKQRLYADQRQITHRS